MEDENLIPDQPGFTQSADQRLGIQQPGAPAPQGFIMPQDAISPEQQAMLDEEERLRKEEEQKMQLHNIEQEAIAAAVSVGNPIVSPGTLDKLGKLSQGVGNFLKGVADTPKNLTYWAANMFMDDAKLDTPEEKKALMTAIDAMSGMYGPAAGVDVVAEGLNDFAAPIIKERDKDFLDEFGEGNIVAGADALVGDVIGALPSVGAAFLGPGGLALIGSSAFGNKFTSEFEEDPSQSANRLFFNAAATAGGELLTETFTAGLGKGVMNVASKLGPKAAKAIGKNAINKMVFGITGEGLSEGAADSWERTMDHAILGKEDAFKGGWKSFAQNAIIGGIIGGGITTAS